MKQIATLLIASVLLIGAASCGKCDMNKSNSSQSTGQKTYTCPMHPDMVSSQPGKCPKCGMDLIEK